MRILSNYKENWYDSSPKSKNNYYDCSNMEQTNDSAQDQIEKHHMTRGEALLACKELWDN